MPILAAPISQPPESPGPQPLPSRRAMSRMPKKATIGITMSPTSPKSVERRSSIGMVPPRIVVCRTIDWGVKRRHGLRAGAASDAYRARISRIIALAADRP